MRKYSANFGVFEAYELYELRLDHTLRNNKMPQLRLSCWILKLWGWSWGCWVLFSLCPLMEWWLLKFFKFPNNVSKGNLGWSYTVECSFSHGFLFIYKCSWSAICLRKMYVIFFDKLKIPTSCCSSGGNHKASIRSGKQNCNLSKVLTFEKLELQ